MATLLENLTTRRDAIGVELAALTSTKVGGTATGAIDGQQVDHVGYRLSLYKELAEINNLIASAEGPWEVLTEALP